MINNVTEVNSNVVSSVKSQTNVRESEIFQTLSMNKGG